MSTPPPPPPALPKPPRVEALRLCTSARDAKPPLPPLGLTAWSDKALASAVLLDGANADLRELSAVVAQVPPAASLALRTPVLVLGAPADNGAAWRRWLGARKGPVGRALRCTALVLRGYVDVGAGLDDAGTDLAWGWSSPEEPIEAPRENTRPKATAD